MVYRPKQKINERVASYIKRTWFCATPNGIRVNAEFPFACVVKAITALGWTVEGVSCQKITKTKNCSGERKAQSFSSVTMKSHSRRDYCWKGCRQQNAVGISIVVQGTNQRTETTCPVRNSKSMPQNC